jgi:hypothetical protein
MKFIRTKLAELTLWTAILLLIAVAAIVPAEAQGYGDPDGYVGSQLNGQYTPGDPITVDRNGRVERYDPDVLDIRPQYHDLPEWRGRAR